MEHLDRPIRRRHVRLKLNRWIPATAALYEIRGKPAGGQGQGHRIRVVDLSPGGLCFRSPLALPASAVYSLVFELTLQSRTVRLVGQIVWRRTEENGYVYGVCLSPAGSDRPALVYLLNELLLEMRPEQRKIHRLYRRMTQEPGAVVPFAFPRLEERL